MAARRSLLLSVALAVCAPAGCSRATEPPRPSIVLITLDTTRFDYLGCYGFRRPASPNLDRLAADSAVFTQAYATSSWTLPTHASLFTGKLPSAHGAQSDPEGPLDLTQGFDAAHAQEKWKRFRVRPLAQGEITLAGILAHQGYATGGVAGGPWLKRVFGLAQGFQTWDDENVGSLNGRPADDVTRAALAFLDAHAARPFLLFANYYDPHEPYLPPRDDLRAVGMPGEDWRTLTPEDQARAEYAAEIHAMDRGIGQVIDRLRALGLYDSSFVIAVADHGQLLGDRYLGGAPVTGHGKTLSEAEIRVPFLVKFPGGSHRGSHAGRISQVDLLPLLLGELGLPSPPRQQGASPLVDGALRAVAHPIVAELHPDPSLADEAGVEAPLRGDWLVGFDGDWKLAWNGLGRSGLVDLAADPREEKNLFGAETVRAAAMEQALRGYLASLPPPGPAGAVGEVDPETLRALRRLGYLGDD